MNTAKTDTVQLVIDRSIDDFFATAAKTTASAIEEGSAGLHLVREIDALFREEVWRDGLRLEVLPATLAINAYYAFIGAARVGLSGHLVAVFPIARQALEYACYCYLLSKRPELQATWTERHTNDLAMKASRKAFRSAVDDCRKLLTSSHLDFSEWLAGLYQSMVDYGAHPNVRSVFPHIDIDDGGEHWMMNLICLYDRGHPKHQSGIILAAEIGLVSSVLVALSSANHHLTDNFVRFEELRVKLGEVAGENENGQVAQAG